MNRSTPQALLLAGIALYSVAVSGKASAALDPQSPWPTANRDLRHTSRAPFVGPQDPKVKWVFTTDLTGATAWGPTVGRDGTIYVPIVSEDGGFLFALTADGKEKWRFDLQGATCNHAALGDDGTIYATGGSLFALTTDGKEKWHFTAAKLAGNQSPTIGPNGDVYQPSQDGTLYVLDHSTGAVKWSQKYTDGKRFQAPISFGLDGDPILAVRTGNIPNVMKLTNDGNVMWKFTGPQEMRSATVGDDGTLYMASNFDNLYALDPNTGVTKWTGTVRESGTAVTEFPALGWDGTVYQGSGEGEVAAFSAKGDSLWRFEPDTHLSLKDPVTGDNIPVHMGTPIVDVTGTLYVPSPVADLWIIGADGKFKGVVDLPEDYRALYTRMGMGADGTIYSGSQNGRVIAFGDDFVMGDVNHDGKVGIGDATRALQMAIGLTTVSPIDLRAADVAPSGTVAGRPYGDGKVSIPDAVSILGQSINPRDNWPYPAAQ